MGKREKRHKQNPAPERPSGPGAPQDWLDRTFLNSWRPYLWIALAGFLLYLKTLYFDFSFLDDNNLILKNFNFISRLSNVFQAFFQDVFEMEAGADAFYRPMLTVTLILDAQWGGASPYAYHLTNLLIHNAVCCLLFALFTRLGYRKDLAFFASLIFTVHPILSQAVAWIPGRNDTLTALFALPAVIFFVRYAQNRSGMDLLGHLCFLALALFTKESAVAVVAVCVLYLWLIREEGLFSIPARRAGLVFGWFVVVLAWLGMRQNAMIHPLSVTPGGILTSLSLNMPGLIQYLGKIFFPLNLAVIPILHDTSYLYGLAALPVLIGALYLSREKRLRWVLFGAGWFLAFILPSFAIVVDYIQHEHRIYLPLVGFLILLMETGLLRGICSRKTQPLAGAALVLAAFSALTFHYEDRFENRLTFWESAAKTAPHSPLAHRNLGAMYYLDARFDEALVEYRKSLSLNSEERMAHNNIGLILVHQGQYAAAEEEYKKELAINPRYDDAYFNYGLLKFRTKKFKDAERLWMKALEINPGHIQVLRTLAIFHFDLKDYRKSIHFANEMQKRGVRPPAELIRALQGIGKTTAPGK